MKGRKEGRWQGRRKGGVIFISSQNQTNKLHIQHPKKHTKTNIHEVPDGAVFLEEDRVENSVSFPPLESCFPKKKKKGGHRCVIGCFFVEAQARPEAGLGRVARTTNNRRPKGVCYTRMGPAVFRRDATPSQLALADSAASG